MIHATRRGVRRNALAKMPAADRPPKATLFNFMAWAAEQGRPVADMDARREQLTYILTTTASGPTVTSCGFRHPTKRATPGRYSFLTLGKAVAKKPRHEAEGEAV